MRILIAAAGFVLAAAANAATFMPAATTDDLNNPHKGFMMWGTSFAAGDEGSNYHGASLYHIYVPWREVETADQVFAWDAFEAHHFAPILAVDPQATFVLRLVADYPDGPASGLSRWYTGGQPERHYPLFLEQAPLSISGVSYANCSDSGSGRTPNWNAPAFATQAQQLIAAFAARYDNDPRITAIQVGLIGLWGEWHQSDCPANVPVPGNAIKETVRAAYANAFTHARLQTRYPRIPDAVGVDFGFHEDYFPSFTASCLYGFPECDDSGDWSMEYGYAHLPAARNNWRVNPISGESPFTAQKNAWINDTADILTVLHDYHFSFLGPAGKHEDPGNDATLATIKRALGYDFSIAQATVPDTLAQGVPLAWRVDVANRGSAPTYHGFEMRLQLVAANGTVAATLPLAADLKQATPEATTRYEGTFTLSGVAPGSYSLRVATVSTTPGRRGITLQNAPRDSEQRVVLGNVVVAAAADLIFANGFQT